MISGLRRVHAELGDADVSHPGLRLAYFVPALGKGREVERDRDEFLDRLAGMSTNGPLAPYRRRFEQWREALAEAGCRAEVWETEGRLALGLGAESVLETGIRLHHTWGVPVVPGSALKGLCRAYAREVYDVEDRGVLQQALFGSAGTHPLAGSVTFHDALWHPPGRPFSLDTTTVHHPEWYQRKTAPPAEWDAPTPLPYLTAAGRFLFAFQAEEAANEELAFCVEVLAKALADWGVGGRTRKGYGRFATGAELPEAELLTPDWAAEVEGGAQVTPGPGAGRPPATRPVALHAEDAIIRYRPNTGEFELEVEGSRGVVPASKEGLVADPDALKRLKKRCRKKGHVRASLDYEILGNYVMATKIHWPPPGQ